MPIPRPHDNTYWVVPDFLLAGEYPGDRNEEIARAKLRLLLKSGINFFVDLTTSEDPLRPYTDILETESRSLNSEATYISKPLPDFDIPESKSVMTDILDEIDRAIESGSRVYVHCWGGVGRTGLVAGCYLVRHGKFGEQALKQLAELWSTVEKRVRYPETPQTTEQKEYVLNWSED